MSKHLNEWVDFEVARGASGPVDSMLVFKKFKKFKSTFDQLPKAELVKRGWIKDINDVASMLPLMRDIQTDRNKSLYRKADSANEALCSAWMSVVSNSAKIKALTQNQPMFAGIDKEYLTYIAKLSIDETIPVHLPEILGKKGIILIYEQALPSMKLDGVVFKLESGHPVIGVSFRYPRLDNFWFTLMHELSHIHLHMEQLDNPIFDDLENDDNDIIELQANKLAKESFVSKDIWRNCEPKYNKSDEALVRFSESIGIHPCIIAGMLRKEANTYTMYNNIVNKIDIRKLVFKYE
jgi:HTH-type transcriptional regulator/antitoxin HigA